MTLLSAASSGGETNGATRPMDNTPANQLSATDPSWRKRDNELDRKSDRLSAAIRKIEEGLDEIKEALSVGMKYGSD